MSPRALRVPVREIVVRPSPGNGTTALADTLICMKGIVVDMA